MIAKQSQAMGVLENASDDNDTMDQMPTNLSMPKLKRDSDVEMCVDLQTEDGRLKNGISEKVGIEKSADSGIDTKKQLSFSVDRLLSDEQSASVETGRAKSVDKCCESLYACCPYPNCLVSNQHDIQQRQCTPASYNNTSLPSDGLGKIYLGQGGALSSAYLDFKSVVRPTPIRAIGSHCETVTLCAPFSALAPTSMLRFHHQQKQTLPHSHQSPHLNLALASTLLPQLSGLKSLQINQNSAQHFRQSSANCFQTKPHGYVNIPSAATTCLSSNSHTTQQQQQQQKQQQIQLETTGSCGSSDVNSNSQSTSGSNNNGNSGANANNGKRKRSWSRAVFSNLQRKGLEIQFQQQKYITKPDRRKLAARLNLTDAQVKVWFQNRRMKWRHTRENLKSGQEKQISVNEAGQSTASDAVGTERRAYEELEQPELGYSSDASSSVGMSENEDDDEIDVVE